MELKSLGFFVFGFVCAVLFFGFDSGLEVPFGTGFAVFDENIGSPSDYMDVEDIVVLDDRVILKIDGATLSSYVDSGSMVPFLDKGANGIRIVPSSEDEVEVGDIVSFRIGGMLVVHRVIEKGVDEKGVYFVVKGDANWTQDGKIRFEDIEYKTIGIIY